MGLFGFGRALDDCLPPDLMYGLLKEADWVEFLKPG